MMTVDSNSTLLTNRTSANDQLAAALHVIGSSVTNVTVGGVTVPASTASPGSAGLVTFTLSTNVTGVSSETLRILLLQSTSLSLASPPTVTRQPGVSLHFEHWGSGVVSCGVST